MQVEKSLMIVLFSLSILVPSDINTGWYDQWLVIKNYFTTLQLPQWFKNVKNHPLKVGLVSVGALAIVGGGRYLYMKRKNKTAPQNPNKPEQGVKVQWQEIQWPSPTDESKLVLKQKEVEDFYLQQKADLFGRIVTLSTTSSAYKKPYIGQSGIVKQVWVVHSNPLKIGLTIKILKKYENKQNWIYLSANDTYQRGEFDKKTLEQNLDVLIKEPYAASPEVVRARLQDKVLDGLDRSISFWTQISKNDIAERDDFKKYVLEYLIKRFDKITNPFNTKPPIQFIESYKRLITELK